MSELGDDVSAENHADFDASEPISELKNARKALEDNDFPKVIKIAEAFIAELPQEPYGYILLGIIAEVSNERAQAIQMMTQAHEFSPDCREIAEALAHLSFLSGNMTDGVYFAKLADTLVPNSIFVDAIPYQFRAHKTSFENMQISRHYIQAMRAYDARLYDICVDEAVRELRQNNHHKLASELLGYALLKTGRAGRAISAFQTAIHLNPKRARSTSGLGEALLKLGRAADARACLYRAMDMDPENPIVLAQCQRGLARIPGGSAADLKAHAAAWLAKIQDDLPSREGRLDHDKGNKVRVGIVSDVFYSSQILHYFATLLDHYDKSKIEVHLYSLCPIKDGSTSRLRNSADSWREIGDIDQFTLAETLARENLDMVIDLCFEADAQAIELFTVGAAKKQVSWFAPFEAASFLGMTHILSDTSTASVDQDYKSDAQICVQPANGILAREPFVAFDNVLPSPVAENKTVMFGMRADPAAIAPSDALTIIDLLRAVPGSRLMLGLTDRLDKETQQRLLDVFSMGGGVGLVLFQELPGSQDNAKIGEEISEDFFQDVDVFLSPSASIEFDDVALSLWMGAPVVAMQGSSRVERLTASILDQAERGDWIAKSPEEFIGIGKSIAGDTKRLAEMRLTLREDVQKTKLFEAPKVAREIWKSLMSICEG